VERAAHLKKHFQEVLFLEPQAKMIDEAVRNWVGISGAATAFVIYFGLQVLQTSAAAGLGLWTLMTVGAVAYALKDRAKELTRQWLSGKLSHLYANRLLALREPEKLERKRSVGMRAREAMSQDRVAVRRRPAALPGAAGPLRANPGGRGAAGGVDRAQPAGNCPHPGRGRAGSAAGPGAARTRRRRGSGAAPPSLMDADYAHARHA